MLVGSFLNVSIMHRSSSLAFHEFRDPALATFEDRMIGSIHEPGLSEKYYLITCPRTARIATYGAHTALSRIAPDRSSRLFPRNKSNTTLKVVFLSGRIVRFLRGRRDDERHVRGLVPSSFIEKSGDLSAGCDGLQNSALHAQALATLRATCGEHCATCFGGHTITETVALSALALVRLIRAFHLIEPFTMKKCVA